MFFHGDPADMHQDLLVGQPYPRLIWTRHCSGEAPQSPVGILPWFMPGAYLNSSCRIASVGATTALARSRSGGGRSRTDGRSSIRDDSRVVAGRLRDHRMEGDDHRLHQVRALNWNGPP